MDGLLNESLCKRSIQIRSEPIADHYAVETRPFARGKFATVRRCRHLATGKEYAAKCMRKRRRAADVRHEILHEAHVLQLAESHPHIVRLHEVYETTSEVVLVLELLTGGEVQRVLDDEEILGEGETTRLLRQILNGLIFLHSHNIAHLDLKPQNLLLTGPFPHGDVKLCDFGISRLVNKGAEIREIVGTPDYVAPEILHYEPISLATDMWSIGILTYVLLSGHSPFGGDTKQETFCNITRGNLDFPIDLFPTTSSLAKNFISCLLQRNPRERMSAEECLNHPWLLTTSQDRLGPGIELTLSPSPSGADSNHSTNNNEVLHNSNSPVKNCPNLKATNDIHIQTNGTKSSNGIIESKRGTDFTSDSNEKRDSCTYHFSSGNVIKSNMEDKDAFFSKTTSFRCEQKSISFVSKSINEQKNDAVSPKVAKTPSDGKSSSTRNVDVMVAQFEGLSSMSKRIVFSEEIIVDERMGIVY